MAQRHEPAISSARRRVLALTTLLEQRAIAAGEAQLFGKKKSIKLAWGSYGTRQQAEKVSVVDPELAIKTLEENKIEGAVKREPKIVMAVASAWVSRQVEHLGVIPDGFDHKAAENKGFAKPDADADALPATP